MLHLLIGRSGSGKSYRLREIARQYIQNNRDVLVIIPEQFSFETGLYFLDENKALQNNIKILSFSRMTEYVFALKGGFHKDFLDEGTSKILMSMAIEQCSDRLTLYERQVKNKNFVNIMLDTVNEYKSNRITPKALLSLKTVVENPTLKQKLEETSLLMETYDTLVGENYINNQDILSYVAEKITEHQIFKDYAVFLDEFTGFTGQQYHLLKAIMSQTQDIYMTLNAESRDGKINEESIRFKITVDTYHKMRALAKQCFHDINEMYQPFTENRRTPHYDMKMLEKNIYAFPLKVCKQKVENVHLYSAVNIYEECEYVATQIKKLTLQENYRYKDIAVVCRDETLYRGILDLTFDKFGIAYFMDNPQNINAKPLVNFIRHAFDSVNGNYPTESILRMLKTGITKYDYEDIALAENYIFVWSPKWTQPFTQNINGLDGGEMTPEETESLQKTETLRQEVLSYLQEFKENTKLNNGLVLSQQVALLMERFGVKEKTEQKIQMLSAKDHLELVDEYTRVWNFVTEIISKMAEVLQHTMLTGKRYHELFTLAVNTRQIANQPLSIDSVTVGTAGRTRLGMPKVVFLIGAVQGVFPAVPTSGGIFTDNERQLLLNLGLPMNSTLADLSAEEQYNAYSSVAGASEKLYISYYTNTPDGSGTLPSTIVTQTERILPLIVTEHQNDIYSLKEEYLWSKAQTFEHTVANLKTHSPDVRAMEQYFLKDEHYASLLQGIQSYTKKEEQKINSDTAKALYSKNLHLSASKVEDFYRCGYLYFCKNGLKLKERRKAKIDSRQYGTLIHYVMEKFLKHENIEDIIQHTENYDIPEIIKEIIESFVRAEYENGKIPDNKTDYMLRRALNSCVILARRMIEELKVSLFRPVDFELSIGISPKEEDKFHLHNQIDEYRIKTEDGTASVVGFVDRVDLFRNAEDGKTYIKIVDYKTGNKELRRCDMEMGLSLQMFIYLSAIIRNGKKLYGNNIEPAGVSYLPAKEISSVTQGYGNTKETQNAVNEARNRHFRANGLFLRNLDVVMAMEETGEGKFIPVKFGINKRSKKQEIAFSSYSEPYLIDGDKNSGTFRLIFDLVDDKIRQMSHMLLNGYINSVPTGKKNEICELPCRYCPYKNSCRFEEGMPVNIIPSSKAKGGEENE